MCEPIQITEEAIAHLPDRESLLAFLAESLACPVDAEDTHACAVARFLENAGRLVAGHHHGGSYYTPGPVVSFMCREALKGYLSGESAEAIAFFVDERNPSALRHPERVLKALQNVKTCDPACGSGAYLVGMLCELFELRSCLSDSGAPQEQMLEIIKNNLYGVDSDPVAVEITRLRLWLALAMDAGLPTVEWNIRPGDSLLPPEVSGFDWAGHYPEVFAEGGFDLILANPPYLSTKHGFGRENRAVLARQYRTATGQFDAYALFIERALMLLKPNGCYSYIVPKPVLTNVNMLQVRRVMQEHRILTIADPGQVFGVSVEPIIVVGQKSPVEEDHVRIYEPSCFVSLLPHQQEQELPLLGEMAEVRAQSLSYPRSLPGPVYTKKRSDMIRPSGAWNILPSRVDRVTSKAGPDYEALPTFGTFFTITRGIECGKRDASILPTAAKGAFPLLRGEDVGCCSISFADLYILPNGDAMKFKPKGLYEGPKLLIRRVANRLIAALDMDGHHVLNTLYVVKQAPQCSLSLEYACALLNSRVLNQHFHDCFVNDDKLFPYVRKAQIDSIPVAIPSAAEENEIRDLVRQAQQNKARVDPILEKLELIMCSIYERA